MTYRPEGRLPEVCNCQVPARAIDIELAGHNAPRSVLQFEAA